jgi:phosphatidylglycerophosphatase A
VCGIGRLSKWCPGTVGSLLAIPFVYFLVYYLADVAFYFKASDPIFLTFVLSGIVLLLLFGAGVYAAGKYESLSKQHDPGEVIIDEVVGQALVLLVTIPCTYVLIWSQNTLHYDAVLQIVSTSGSVGLFRLFDILKPWPIKLIDQKVPGGLGIMLDDIVAAVFAIVVYLACLLIVVDVLMRVA